MWLHSKQKHKLAESDEKAGPGIEHKWLVSRLNTQNACCHHSWKTFGDVALSRWGGSSSITHTHTQPGVWECDCAGWGSYSKLLLEARMTSWAAITSQLYTISVWTRNKRGRLDSCPCRHAWYPARDEATLDQTALYMLVEAALPAVLLAVAVTGAVSTDSSRRWASFIWRWVRKRSSTRAARRAAVLGCICCSALSYQSTHHPPTSVCFHRCVHSFEHHHFCLKSCVQSSFKC